ncbi:MAG: hypothetical protein LBR95_09485, partial [Azoarcus sp.]|nr:hypothetical protein [Azoarcus sp.]
MPLPERTLRQVLARRRVALYSDGDICRSMLAWLQEQDFEITAIMDPHVQEPGATQNGIPVLSPESFAERETPIVICLNESEGFAAEARTLRRLGFFVLPYHALFGLEAAAPENVVVSSGLARRLRRIADFMAKTGKSVLYDGLVFAAAVFDFVVCLLAFPRECADLLLIIPEDGLGDFVIRQDALRAFRAKYARRKVFLVCEAAY